MTQHDLTGRTLGQYTITEQLGRGGMADVYKAFHPQLEVYRAIKVIRPEFVTASDFRARFQKEAQAVAALRHPNIVTIHDFGEQDDAYYMVMEFIQGRDLKRVIEAEGRIRPIDRAVEIVDQVAGALHYAHSRGLIHRDIKPENIMIGEDGLPILTDFGIAKLLTANTQLTQTGLGVGTPFYMAPEQAKALPEIGPAADIYSLSVVLYEMLTGRVPYSADTPMAVMLKAINDPMPLPRTFSTDISESLQQVILKGTAKEPNNRYPTALELQEALHRALRGEPAPAGPAATEIYQPEAAAQTPPPAVDAQSPGPARGLLGYGLAAIVLAVIGTGVYLAFGPEPPTVTEEPKSTETAESAAADQEPAPAESGEAESGQASAPAGDAVVTAGAEGGKLLAEKATTKPGTAKVYAVEARQDDVLYLQVYEASETTDFTLTTPDGRTRVFRDTSNHGPVTLPESGRYELTALTRGERAAEIDFVLWRLDPAVVDGGAIEPGKFTPGETTMPGQVVSYTLDAGSGQTLFFDFTEASETTDFVLTAPDGRTQVFKDTNDHGPFTVDQTGTYTLTADPRYDRVSQFEFNMRDVETPVVDGGVIELGTFTRGETTVAGQVVSYTFDAEDGQTLFFDFTEASETTDFVLTAPDGRTEVFKDTNDRGPFTVDQAGTYTLTADPRYDRVSQFEFNMRHVETPVVDGGAIELGKFTRGETTVAGQVVSYTLDARSGQTLVFEVAETSETTDFTLIAPDARTEVFKDTNGHGPFTVDQAGTYTLTADPRYDRVSQFEFALRPGD